MDIHIWNKKYVFFKSSDFKKISLLWRFEKINKKKKGNMSIKNGIYKKSNAEFCFYMHDMQYNIYCLFYPNDLWKIFDNWPFLVVKGCGFYYYFILYPVLNKNLI